LISGRISVGDLIKQVRDNQKCLGSAYSPEGMIKRAGDKLKMAFMSYLSPGEA
jgi:hypothetical protein